MSGDCCPFRVARRPALARRCLGTVQWALPATILALMPKCPACVAAYVALAAGIGISIPTAGFLRVLLITLCVASLAFLAARRIRRVIEVKSATRKEKRS